MIARILNIAWKEMLHLRKDRILIPFFILGALGELSLIAWATSQPIDNLNMLVLDLDHSQQSAALIDTLSASHTLSLQGKVEDIDTIYGRMNKPNTLVSDVTVLGVVIPENYGADLLAGKQPTVRLILNGAESVGSLGAKRTAEEMIFQQGMRDLFHLEPETYANQLPQITVKYNEKLKRGWYTLPAEMGLMFYVMTVAIAALAITRERERGTYEQLLVMPIRPVEIIIGKALAPIAVGYGLFLSMLFMTTVVFGVPLRGSLLLLLILALVYLLSEIGKGIMLSMTSRTQLQAFMLVFAVAMVDIVFSGYAVAVESMPKPIRLLANFIPIRHWLIISRGIMLKNVGLNVLYPHILALIAIGSVIIAFTATQYRRHFS